MSFFDVGVVPLELFPLSPIGILPGNAEPASLSRIFLKAWHAGARA